MKSNDFVSEEEKLQTALSNIKLLQFDLSEKAFGDTSICDVEDESNARPCNYSNINLS